MTCRNDVSGDPGSLGVTRSTAIELALRIRGGLLSEGEAFEAFEAFEDAAHRVVLRLETT